MAKPPKTTPPPVTVRTRRAYFDFQHGQLHVRTAFPTTGGFDEQVTLFCLHSGGASSRSFVRVLPEMADVRSVYAPDLPGCGESDPSPHATVSEAAGAVRDLAADLRLRQIDVFGVNTGAAVALELAVLKPDLVRRLALIGIPEANRLPTLKHPALVLRTRLDDAQGLPRIRAAMPNAKIVDIPELVDDLLNAAPKRLAEQVGVFLGGKL